LRAWSGPHVDVGCRISLCRLGNRRREQEGGRCSGLHQDGLHVSTPLTTLATAPLVFSEKVRKRPGTASAFVASRRFQLNHLFFQ